MRPGGSSRTRQKNNTTATETPSWLSIVHAVFGDRKTTHGFHVIYGKREQSTGVENLPDSPGIEIRFLKNLHAKCYLNEKEALLTSMNLHEFSQENNAEMGILVSKEKDRQLYDGIHEQAMIWKKASRCIETEDSGELSRRFCIRCKGDIPDNRDVPFCGRHWKTWNRFKNEDYPEEYCHYCGNEYETTKSKPLCRACFRRARARS